TVTGGGNQSQGYAQIGLYNLLTNRMYMGYNFSVPANNINWNTLVTGTYLNGDFKSLDALVDQIITSMLAIGTPANGTNNPKLVQIGADNQEIILITPQTIILPATNVRLYYNGADVPTPGLTQLSAPATVRVELSGGMEMLRWDAVQNASGYMVTVQGTSFQQTISATQMPFSNLNLTAPGNYIILVKALGNGTTTSDSAATAYNHVIQDGGTTIGHEDFMLMFILQELNNNNPIPPTVQTWNQLLPVFGRYASFEALFNGVKEHISTLKGITVVNITQITGGAGTGSSEIPITAQTTFNSNTMIRAYFGTGGTTTLYTLTVVNGTGTTTVNAGTSVTATATIPSGKAFIGWAENGVTISTANPYTFALTRTMTLTAVFEDTGGGTGTTHENFTPGQMKNILDGMNGSPIPATIMTNWQTILNFFSTYSNLELLLNDVKTAITADTGKTIVNITLISNAPIMMGTQFNQHYLIHWVNTTPAKTLDRIQTVQTPQTTFTAGQQYNIGGGTVIAVYTDGTSAPINGLFTVFLRNEADPQGEYTVTGRPLTINDTKVVLSYTENGITKTFDINITVTAGGTTLPRLDAPTNIRVEDVDPTGTMKILRWDVVPNASGYVVFIENRGEFTVSANAHSLSNLTPGMYRITVRAIGGANYSDSELTAFMHIVN
ncbi:MAG: fibronectin type III domain-containing protein, partial [Treponema sp.]|nr:fibronectin type III domain-containing protein [Treponema sp.]